MLRLPGNLDAAQFLAEFWQKKPLLMPRAIPKLKPAVTRNELAWLATLEDVESRIVFTDRSRSRIRYHAESGPFDEDFLAGLPPRDWTLLVHDVEKHLPAMRKVFRAVPFIPDWRIDDLMVSFAAPGGGVGPHRDNYDVFLCQGIGSREWHATNAAVDDDPRASDELALTREFQGELSHACRNGDVLYLPPGAAHWGIARKACITYSIGMRAPQHSDLLDELPDTERCNPFYRDPDLDVNEVRPGFISDAAVHRAVRALESPCATFADMAKALGRFATATKQWITPELPGKPELAALMNALDGGQLLRVHGMTRIAWTNASVFVNGASTDAPSAEPDLLAELCASRRLRLTKHAGPEWRDLAAWMARQGAFEYVK